MILTGTLSAGGAGGAGGTNGAARRRRMAAVTITAAITAARASEDGMPQSILSDRYIRSAIYAVRYLHYAVFTTNISMAAASRDERFLSFARHKGRAASAAVQSKTPGGKGGAALRRIPSMDLAPSRQDMSALAAKRLLGAKTDASAGASSTRTVPIGFAKYKSPIVNPLMYNFYHIAGWRVAVPRALDSLRTNLLLQRMYRYGPESAGYVRLGDTLVPAILSTGDRMSLTQSAYFDPDGDMPLSA